MRSEITDTHTHDRRRATRDFRVIDETDEYLVVDKPPLLLIHPTRPDGAPTLWNAVRELLAFEIANGGQVSIINRLDRETSGLVLIAKTSEAARRFHLAMEHGAVRKQYVTIVHGWPGWDSTTVDAPIIRQGRVKASAIWLKRAIDPRGAAATTVLEVVARFTKSTSAGDKFAVVRATPLTGRTHQIRVHLSSLGFPIVGDKIYGADEQLYLRFIETGWTDELAARLLLPRHALHSSRLSVGDLTWTSDWPADLREFCGDALQTNRATIT